MQETSDVGRSDQCAGTAMLRRRSAVLVGHSHTGALVRAIVARALGSQPDRDELVIAMFKMYQYGGEPPYIVKDAAGLNRFNPTITGETSDFSPSDALYIASFGGNDWAVLSMIQHARPFDFVMPGYESLPNDPEADLLPVGYIKSILTDLTRRWLEQAGLLRQATTSPIYLFMPPPPIADNAFLEGRLDAFFQAQTKFTGRVGSKTLRLKMWVLQNSIYRDACSESQIIGIEASAQAQDQEGFLRSEYYGDDATHANPSYGDLMLDQLESITHSRLLWWYWFPQ